MIRVYLQKEDIWYGNGIKATGLIVKAEAGEAITALDACYIKASDGLAYQLGTAVGEANTSVAIMALEAVTINTIGRFMLRGVIEYGSWTLTPGYKTSISATPGVIAEVAE